MHVGDLCSRTVATCRRDTRVCEIARLMRERDVDAVVVVEPLGEQRPRPVGLVTEHDLVVQVMARGQHPGQLQAGDLLAGLQPRAQERDSVWEAFGLMCGQDLRRLPVVDEGDGLVGLLGADDVMRAFAQALAGLARTGRPGAGDAVAVPGAAAATGAADMA